MLMARLKNIYACWSKTSDSSLSQNYYVPGGLLTNPTWIKHFFSPDIFDTEVESIIVVENRILHNIQYHGPLIFGIKMPTFWNLQKNILLMDALEKLTGSSVAELVTFLAWSSTFLSLSIPKNSGLLFALPTGFFCFIFAYFVKFKFVSFQPTYGVHWYYLDQGSLESEKYHFHMIYLDFRVRWSIPEHKDLVVPEWNFYKRKFNIRNLFFRILELLYFFHIVSMFNANFKRAYLNKIFPC